MNGVRFAKQLIILLKSSYFSKIYAIIYIQEVSFPSLLGRRKLYVSYYKTAGQTLV